jgi:hypothetical protein
MAYLSLFIRALAMTVCIEAAVTGALKAKFNRWLKINCGYFRLAIVTVFASCLTLPYVWFVFPEIIKDRLIFGIVSEIFAWIAESAFYWAALKIPSNKALVLSGLANGASFLIGLMVIS